MIGARKVGVTACLVAGSLLAPLAATAVWLRVDVLSRPGFARHVDDALGDRGVQTELSNQVISQIRAPGAPGGTDETVLADVARSVLATQALRTMLRREIDQLHTQLVHGRTTLALDPRPAVDRVRETVTLIDPRVAALLPDDSNITPIVLARRHDAPALWLAVRRAERLQFTIPLALLAVVALGVVLARRRVHELAIAGAGIALAVLLSLVALRITRGVVRSSIPARDGRAAFDGVWAAFAAHWVRDLRLGGLVGLGLAGAMFIRGRMTRGRRDTVTATVRGSSPRRPGAP